MNGFFSPPWWGYVVYTLVLTHITIASVTIFLHRYQAHRALILRPAGSHFFRFWLWLTTGMITREWVAVHRKHHARVETVDDPHSPQVMGIRKVLLQGAELYQKEAANPDTIRDYGHKTPDDRLENLLYSRFPALGIGLMLLTNFLLFGFIGITVWAVQMFWIPFFAAGVINGIGHWRGYRNYESRDASTNIVPWGILIGGEEMHNNHHAFTNSARFSSKWWEFDLGWFYIRLLEFLGQAKVKKMARKPVINHNKTGIDVDTVRAVMSNRLQIMAHYARDVVTRVYQEEKAKADAAKKRLFRQGKRFIIRADILMDTTSRQRLEVLLGQSEPLQVVYEFKQRLQSLWQEKTAPRDSLIPYLQEWCRQAEESGIVALQDFAKTLRGYTLLPG